jgi:hypothetical protein
VGNILDAFTVSRDHIQIKFNITVQAESLINGNFSVATTDATPVFFSNAFKTINVEDHFNSVSRTLVLFFQDPTILDTGEEYFFVISKNLKRANGNPIGEDKTYTFTYNFEHVVEPPLGSKPTQFTLVDKSIKATVFTLGNSSITTGNPDFHIVKTDPEADEIFVPTDHNNGTIIVEFSQRPAIWFLDDKYFRVQKKSLGNGVGRWETLDIKIAIAVNEPIVYLYLPSDDATPAYNTPGRVYFESGYQYRVRMNAEIGVS